MILSEIIEKYISGDWGNEEKNDDTPNEVFCIRGADFVPILSVDYTKIPTRYISDTSYKNKQLKVGDIIIEKSGGSPTQSTGRVILVTEELLREKQHVVCSNFCEAFRVKKEWNPIYVFTYLQFLYNEGVFFNFEGKTSGLKNLQMEQAFNSIDIPEQKSDISILASIDKKIALNRKINNELESLAKEIYDYWFVQFDFPDEEGKPYKSSGGKMVWNETLKREIPDGWEASCLKHCLDFSNGINYEKDIVGDKKYRIINVRNITSSTIFINKDELDIICLPSNRAEKYIINKEDLIIARSGTPGSIRLISSPKDVIYCGFIIKGTPKDPTQKYYLMYYIKQFEGTQATNTGGSILNNVSQETLNMVDIILPQKDILLQFNNMIEELFVLANNYQEQTNELLRLHAFYLPLLSNGQITIKD